MVVVVDRKSIRLQSLVDECHLRKAVGGCWCSTVEGGLLSELFVEKRGVEWLVRMSARRAFLFPCFPSLSASSTNFVVGEVLGKTWRRNVIITWRTLFMSQIKRRTEKKPVTFATATTSTTARYQQQQEQQQQNSVFVSQENSTKKRQNKQNKQTKTKTKTKTKKRRTKCTLKRLRNTQRIWEWVCTSSSASVHHL